MEIESSLIAAQNAFTITPAMREPQEQAKAREQQNQRLDTELPRRQIVSRQSSPEAFAQADKFRQQQQYSNEPYSARNRTAIDAYQSLANAQQRVNIQQMLGIDTYV